MRAEEDDGRETRLYPAIARGPISGKFEEGEVKTGDASLHEGSDAVKLKPIRKS
jgi:hypothetical protein